MAEQTRSRIIQDSEFEFIFEPPDVGMGPRTARSRASRGTRNWAAAPVRLATALGSLMMLMRPGTTH